MNASPDDRAGLDDLLRRVRDLMAAEGATPINVLRLDEVGGGPLEAIVSRKRSGPIGEADSEPDLATDAPSRPIPSTEMAILQFSKADAESQASLANVDRSLVFPLTLRVVRDAGAYRVEADRFYLKAGELENADPERVQRLIREVDEMVDRVVSKV